MTDIDPYPLPLRGGIVRDDGALLQRGHLDGPKHARSILISDERPLVELFADVRGPRSRVGAFAVPERKRPKATHCS